MNNELRDIIKLEKAYVKPASKMLARAFYDDPINLYAHPDTAERDKRLPYEFESGLLYGLRYGVVHTTSDQIEGVSFWLHSDRASMSFRRLLLSGAIVSASRVGQEGRRRMQILSKYIDKKRRELAPYNHWYLVLLGVDPKFQGRGYASRLIRGMLTRIDEEGLPCYLETDGERNVYMYRHFGFEVIDEFIIPETNVRQCAMLRQNADI